MPSSRGCAASATWWSTRSRLGRISSSSRSRTTSPAIDEPSARFSFSPLLLELFESLGARFFQRFGVRRRAGGPAVAHSELSEVAARQAQGVGAQDNGDERGLRLEKGVDRNRRE